MIDWRSQPKQRANSLSLFLLGPLFVLPYSASFENISLCARINRPKEQRRPKKNYLFTVYLFLDEQWPNSQNGKRAHSIDRSLCQRRGMPLLCDISISGSRSGLKWPLPTLNCPRTRRNDNAHSLSLCCSFGAFAGKVNSGHCNLRKREREREGHLSRLVVWAFVVLIWSLLLVSNGRMVFAGAGTGTGTGTGTGAGAAAV